MGPFYHSKRFQDSIQVSSSSFGSSNKSESIFLPVVTRRDHRTSQETGSGKGTGSGNSRLFSLLFLLPKKSGKLRPVIDLSLLNQYINKQPFMMETVKSVSQSIIVNDWAVSIDLMDAYLHIPIHPISRKYLWFVYGHQAFQFTALLFGMSPSPQIFTKLMEVIAAHLRHRVIFLFPYLDDWLIRDLIRNQLISHTKYCLQMVQNQGFISNLKKSDLIPTQKFTFIGIEFLTQQNIVRVLAD